MVKTSLLSILLLLSGLPTAFAAPQVSGTTITWLDDGWYQVLTADDYTAVCNGGASCEVEPGNYIVINHTTGERFENFIVSGTTINSGVSVEGNCISWPDDGWYKVQTADDYVTICDGGQRCSVDPGTYNLIDQITGTKFNNVIVPSVQMQSAITVEGNNISWPDDGWYQVQSASSFESVCQGGFSCTVQPGTYIVINHTTGERFEAIEVVGEIVDTVPNIPQGNLSDIALGDEMLAAAYSASANNITAFVQGMDPSNNNWVGLYEEGATVCDYITWMFLNGSQEPGGLTGEGELKFDVSELAEGNYSLKLFPNNTFQEAASVPVRISQLTAEYNTKEHILRVEHRNDPETSQDWIGVYRIGDPVNSYIARQFANNSKRLTFSNLDLQPGQYLLKYFSDNSFVELHTENFSVKGTLKNLMYLGFNTPLYGDLKSEHLLVLSDSPYDTLAVQLRGAYSQEPIHGMQEKLAASDSRVWPWVYLNRMLGSPDANDTKSNGAPCDDGSSGSFDNIRPIFPIHDSNNIHYKDFISSFHTALSLAKRSGADGIVLDTEMYNNSCAVRFPYLSSKLGKSYPELKKLLLELGKTLADITHSTIENNAKILVLWNALETNNTITGFIIKGMLERAIEKGYSFKIIESGQGQINWPRNSYFQCSSQLAIESNEMRTETYSPWIQKYSKNLMLGATTGLLQSVNLASGWVREIFASCDTKSIDTLEDQIPALEYLFNNFEFVWIYGTSHANYNLFNPDNRDAIHPTLIQLLPRIED